MSKLKSTSNILYVRAGLSKFSQDIKKSGGVLEFFHEYIDFSEIMVPFFSGSRLFWKKRLGEYVNNSGALGKRIVTLPRAFISSHLSHRFVGIGKRIETVLKEHNYNESCFFPIKRLADEHDFSMLLIGCVNESPGFSTVHATQYDLGLTQKHILRYLLRWDFMENGVMRSKVAPESPGCSLSFGKFYSAYARDGNFFKGEIADTNYIFIPSARRAMTVEKDILMKNPRFIDCEKKFCITCRLRFY